MKRNVRDFANKSNKIHKKRVNCAMPTHNKGGVAVPVQDLVLAQEIDNSIAQQLSFYSVAPSSPPFPRHIFSPFRTTSGGGYNLSRELRSRFVELDNTLNHSSVEISDDFTDSLTIDRENASPAHGGSITTRSDISGMNSLFQLGDESSLNKYMLEIANKDDGSVGSQSSLKRKGKKSPQSSPKQQKTYKPMVRNDTEH